MADNNTSNAPSAVRRRSTLDKETVDALEKRLGSRPEKEELQERNILKDDSVAPALQAAREKLQRSQLEDKLAHAIQQRPNPQELVEKGILSDEVKPAES
ncbi:hypothetical protein CONPUDRAFT_101470 [Coniophora puteana RWD-64-598 SS2]|uniref:RPEL repeat protein n=1 Tax=Coniophora puteana (strain RWD-64-598) TaxID=741705 RepID=A0A5M3MV46_CONPW|nr:uncharacterized protein CONPUDRAFT_101470 [Coniophora puteana RWD-64-598 SS2]EIW82993.1 hypothetical protein CONPUDRAFT_101470 [Coniophora puteana RWD-64-598 SS2]